MVKIKKNSKDSLMFLLSDTEFNTMKDIISKAEKTEEEKTFIKSVYSKTIGKINKPEIADRLKKASLIIFLRDQKGIIKHQFDKKKKLEPEKKAPVVDMTALVMLKKAGSFDIQFGGYVDKVKM